MDIDEFDAAGGNFPEEFSHKLTYGLTEKELSELSDLNKEKNIKLKVATPTVDGEVSVGYFLACFDLMTVCSQVGISINFDFEIGNSIIQQARNKLANKFVQSDCTHILMIDSDISFQGADILKLILLDKDVISAGVSRKGIHWEVVKNRLLLKESKGEQVNPEDLAYFGSVFNFTPSEDKDGNKITNSSKEEKPVVLVKDEPVKAMSVGTALMLVKKHVFQKIREKYPELKYYQHLGNERKVPFFGEDKKVGEEMYAYFELIKDSDGQIMGEDVSFCNRVNNSGLQTWAFPWMDTVHSGSHNFLFNLSRW